MAKDGGDWPIARRARRHLGTPRSRSLPVRGRIPSRVSTPSWLPLTIFFPIFCVSSSRFVFNRGDRQNASILKDPTRTKSFVPSVGPPDAEHGAKGARMVGSLCAISPAHATDDQQQMVATSGFPAPWLTRCMILYGAHDVACLGHSCTYLPRFLSDVRWKNVASEAIEAIVLFDHDGQTLETFLIGGGVHSRPAQAAQNSSEAELPGLIIRAIVWSKQQSAEGARPVQVKYLKPLRKEMAGGIRDHSDLQYAFDSYLATPDAATPQPGAKPSGFEALQSEHGLLAGEKQDVPGSDSNRSHIPGFDSTFHPYWLVRYGQKLPY
ncbi:hypothetical protein ASPFODRAFT_64944 [Aspergillus luchuensis CBS 106.47]|uniref:Uncharacterized protein n=1 Tax=Aspergillus luchuensis (strain CBS 106.47) TaxID=1137211 RepID=A0A1M3T456_ASPLC|nr:hypothetical protein ASPFODRAFT_64944 [Aspergillus luchuensis CBS 106.47]